MSKLGSGLVRVKERELIFRTPAGNQASYMSKTCKKNSLRLPILLNTLNPLFNPLGAYFKHVDAGVIEKRGGGLIN